MAQTAATASAWTLAEIDEQIKQSGSGGAVAAAVRHQSRPLLNVVRRPNNKKDEKVCPTQVSTCATPILCCSTPTCGRLLCGFYCKTPEHASLCAACCLNGLANSSAVVESHLMQYDAENVSVLKDDEASTTSKKATTPSQKRVGQRLSGTTTSVLVDGKCHACAVYPLVGWAFQPLDGSSTSSALVPRIDLHHGHPVLYCLRCWIDTVPRPQKGRVIWPSATARATSVIDPTPLPLDTQSADIILLRNPLWRAILPASIIRLLMAGDPSLFMCDSLTSWCHRVTVLATHLYDQVRGHATIQRVQRDRIIAHVLDTTLAACGYGHSTSQLNRGLKMIYNHAPPESLWHGHRQAQVTPDLDMSKWAVLKEDGHSTPISAMKPDILFMLPLDASTILFSMEVCTAVTEIWSRLMDACAVCFSSSDQMTTTATTTHRQVVHMVVCDTVESHCKMQWDQKTLEFRALQTHEAVQRLQMNRVISCSPTRVRVTMCSAGGPRSAGLCLVRDIEPFPCAILAMVWSPSPAIASYIRGNSSATTAEKTDDEYVGFILDACREILLRRLEPYAVEQQVNASDLVKAAFHKLSTSAVNTSACTLARKIMQFLRDRHEQQQAAAASTAMDEKAEKKSTPVVHHPLVKDPDNPDALVDVIKWPTWPMYSPHAAIYNHCRIADENDKNSYTKRWRATSTSLRPDRLWCVLERTMWTWSLTDARWISQSELV